MQLALQHFGSHIQVAILETLTCSWKKKKTIAFFSKFTKCQKAEKGTSHSFLVYTVQVSGPFSQALMGPQLWMFQLGCPFPLQLIVAPTRLNLVASRSHLLPLTR